MSAESLQNFPIADLFCYITKQGIAIIAVPLFLFISGYLFFLNASSFSRSLYFKKLKKRFWTLCVPLVIWGTLFFLAEFLEWKFNLDILRRHRAFDNYSAPTFLRDFFIYGICAKDLVPLWFIRDLVFMCITSPLWFFLLKKFKLFPVILFGFCLYLHIYPSEFVSNFLFVVFFFCFGAYFSIHGIDFTKVFSKIRILLFIVYPLVIVGGATLSLLGFTDFCNKMSSLEATIGLVATVALASLFLEKRPTTSFPKTLFSATFFVYAGHFFLVSLLVPMFPSLFPCETSLGIIMAFLGSTLFAVVACVLLSVLVRKFAPWSIRFLTGGR